MSIRTGTVGLAFLIVSVARGGEADSVDPDWRRSIERSIAAIEYQVGVGPGGILGAPNRAHGIRVTFAADGIRARPRTEDVAAFDWGLEFSGFGRGKQVVRPEAAVPTAKGNRVEYDRGNVVEWYVNDANGLEQGFTITARPEGEGELAVVLAIRGTLEAFERDGAIDFATNVGAVALRYEKLLAFDANGSPLGARMRLANGSIWIGVDDGGASYPITIDPLTTSPAWTAESNQEASEFGFSVATAGDVNGDGYSDVVVGAHYFDNGQADEGRAFVYHGSAVGLAASPAWTAESNNVDAEFGFSVATAGDVNGDGYSEVIVGAPYFTSDQVQEGAAFIYRGSAAGLTPSPAWTLEGNQHGGLFGWSVATAGDVNSDGYSDVVVGALLFDNSHVDAGRASVYLGSSAGLAASPSWTAEGNQVDAFFGQCVGTAGDANGDGYSDVVVRQRFLDGSPFVKGRTLVFHGATIGLAGTPAWTLTSNQQPATYQVSASTAGDVNGDGYSDLVLATFSNVFLGTSSEASLYLGSAVVGLAATPAWTVAMDESVSVATAGDVNGDGYADVVVGAPSFTGLERVFVYSGSTSGLGASPIWTAESSQQNAEFGSAVATAGDVNGDGYSDLLVGAPYFDNPQSNEGRAFAYLGSSGGPAVNPAWMSEGNQSGAAFGASIATVGDLDGDGYSDVVVGAPRFDNGETDEGRVFVYSGSASGLSASPTWTAEGNQALALFGTSVASAGDVNGDGFSDLIVGADQFDNGQSNEGRAFVYLSMVVSPAWIAESNQAAASFGASVASAGDVNGDGYSDIVVGSTAYDNEGRAFVYLGSATGLAASAAWTAKSNQVLSQFGSSVAPAGDVNGDGFSDVVVGARQFDNGESDEGRAFVYFGSASSIGDVSPAWTAEGNQDSAWFGIAVAGAGDVNGDGYSDVVVGAYRFDNGENNEGRAFAYLGSPVGLNTSPAWTAESNQASAEFGYSVAAAGDVNGDGYADVIIGARLFDNPESNEGRAFVYLGSAAGLGATAAWTAESQQASARFGSSVATAGDVNGDGYSDIIIGAPDFANGAATGGRAFLYYGNEGSGRVSRLRQLRLESNVPIAVLGRTITGGYRVRMDVRSPFGRGDARLAVESKPLGTPFNGSALTFSALTDTIVGDGLSVSLNGLASNTKHHWRARVVHSKVTTPLLPAGPWFSIQGNAASELDLRTAVCGSTLATATPYGNGKPGTLGIPLLSSATPPAKGATSDVTISGGLPGASPVILFAGFAPAAIPFDGGVLRVNPTFTIALPPLDGAGSLSLPVQHSADPSTCGLHLYFQAIFADPGASGFYHTAQTNGLDWFLGS